MKSGDGPSEGLPKVSDLRPSTSQTCDRSGLKNETQTHRKNPSNKPVEDTRVAAKEEKTKTPSQPLRPNGLWKGTERRKQTSFLLPLQGGSTQKRSEVARAKAQQRWENDIMRQRSPKTEVIVDWLTLERMEQATEAELAKSGGGMEYILRQMRELAASA